MIKDIENTELEEINKSDNWYSPIRVLILV